MEDCLTDGLLHGIHTSSPQRYRGMGPKIENLTSLNKVPDFYETSGPLVRSFTRGPSLEWMALGCTDQRILVTGPIKL